MTQNLKIGASLMKNFIKLDIKNSDPKPLTLRVWGIKTSLEQFAFSEGLIKPLVENPSSNFHKQYLIFPKTMK